LYLFSIITLNLVMIRNFISIIHFLFKYVTKLLNFLNNHFQIIFLNLIIYIQNYNDKAIAFYNSSSSSMCYFSFSYFTSPKY